MPDEIGKFPSPLVIGGVGGSGTRVVARIARRAGYDLGTDLNPTEDAVQLRLFCIAWVNRILDAERRDKALSRDETQRMNEDFRRAVARHLFGSAISEADGPARWGWKAPRSIYLLPLLYEHFPKLKFIHVIRDGRDMAFSKNQSQLRKHGPFMLSWWERSFYSLPKRSLLLWGRVNLAAADFAEAKLGQNYQLVRFEDLCHAPVKTTARIMELLDADVDAQAVARAEISEPSTIGRWRTYPPRVISKLEGVAETALRKFGYLG